MDTHGNERMRIVIARYLDIPPDDIDPDAYIILYHDRRWAQYKTKENE